MEKENLIKTLQEQYAQNIISVEEYEKILEYINKIETKKEIKTIQKIIQEENRVVLAGETAKTHLALFSWRTSHIKPLNKNAGKYTSLFGANRIILGNIPRGTTILNVNSIFGLTEVIVPENVKIINEAFPIFSGIFASNKTIKDDDAPELHITGKAIFGNITIKHLN
jgi:hypothetical protein